MRSHPGDLQAQAIYQPEALKCSNVAQRNLFSSQFSSPLLSTSSSINSTITIIYVSYSASTAFCWVSFYVFNASTAFCWVSFYVINLCRLPDNNSHIIAILSSASCCLVFLCFLLFVLSFLLFGLVPLLVVAGFT
jgi:hypothetical protein